ncbi:MAG: insulinase family protein [Balneolaceae bacterium]|nr:MAG: insulinase family protein [Balneolaceae bacterium]
MKMRNLIITLLLFVCASASIMGQTRYNELTFPDLRSFDLPNVESFDLKNGIKVFLVEDNELPLINMTVLVRAGSFMESGDKVGLAGMTGTVMRTGGTETYPGDELNELLEARAASIETGFGMASGSAFMGVLKEDFDDLLPVFKDVMLNPAFPQDKIDLVKTQNRSAISRRNDNPGPIAAREFNKLIYGEGTVYARYTEYEHIDNITREDMIDFHAKAYNGANLMIAVIGDFRTRDMKRKIERTFTDIPRGTKRELDFPPVDYSFDISVNFVNKTDVNQSNIRIGHIGGRRANPDYAALQVMNQILSGGFSGRLLQEVRTNLGYAYSVGGSYISNIHYDGVFFITLSTASENTASAIEASLNEVVRLQNEPVTEEELAATKDRMLNSIVFRYDSKNKILNEQVSNTYNGLPMDAFDRYIDEVRKVTVADIQRVAREYIQPENVHILVVGNGNEIGDQLERLGEVNSIDITIPRPGQQRTEAAGDKAKGAEWLGKMASAIIPESAEINSLTIQSEIAMQTPMGAMNIRSTTVYEYPGTILQELNTPQGLINMEFRDGSGTMRMGQMSQPLPAQQADQMKRSLNQDYVNIARNRNNQTAEYLGMHEIEGKELVKIHIGPDADITFYIDPENGLPFASKVSNFNPATGGDTDTYTFYENWTLSDGVNVAYKIVNKQDGEIASTITTNSHSAE